MHNTLFVCNYTNPRRSHPLPFSFHVFSRKLKYTYIHTYIHTGRGQLVRNHPGNVSFRTDFIRARSARYDRAANREQKNAIALEILDDIADLGRRFLKQHSGAGYWTELDTKTAKEKVMMAFREFRKSQRNQQQQYDREEAQQQAQQQRHLEQQLLLRNLPQQRRRPQQQLPHVHPPSQPPKQQQQQQQMMQVQSSQVQNRVQYPLHQPEQQQLLPQHQYQYPAATKTTTESTAVTDNIKTGTTNSSGNIFHPQHFALQQPPPQYHQSHHHFAHQAYSYAPPPLPPPMNHHQHHPQQPHHPHYPHHYPQMVNPSYEGAGGGTSTMATVTRDTTTTNTNLLEAAAVMGSIGNMINAPVSHHYIPGVSSHTAPNDTNNTATSHTTNGRIRYRNDNNEDVVLDLEAHPRHRPSSYQQRGGVGGSNGGNNEQSYKRYRL